MTDEQRLREAVEGHVAEHRQTSGPGSMAINDDDRLARANILAAIVDELGITEAVVDLLGFMLPSMERMEDAGEYWAEEDGSGEVRPSAVIAAYNVAEQALRALLDASKGADDA